MPKYKKYDNSVNSMAAFYSVTALETADEAMKKYIQDNIQPKQTETDFILKNQDAIIKAVADDKLQSEGKPTKEAAEEFARKINPNYRPLSEKEVKERTEISETLQKKYAEFAAKRNIVVSLANSEPPHLTRTEQCLLSLDTSEAGIAFNKHIKELLKSGDPKKVEQAYKEGLEKFQKVDISNVDLTNDKYVVDHFEDLYPIISSGAEFASLINSYQQFHIMDKEEDKKVFEHLGTMTEMGFQLRQKIDIIASQSYSQLRSEDLLDAPNFLDADSVITNEDGDFISAETALFGNDNAADKLYMNGLRQIVTTNIMNVGNPLLDKNLSPKERVEQYKAHYWDKEKPEVRPLFHKEKKDAEIQLRKNIAEIKKIIPNFEISEEKIKSYVSTERFMLKQRAKEVVEDQNDRGKISLEIKDKPSSFKRAAFAIIKPGKTEEEKQFNEEFAEKITDPSYEGQFYRKNLFVEYAEKIKTLDISKLDNVSFEEAAKYSLDNMDVMEVGMEFQRTNQDKVHSMGFDINPELKEDLKNIENKGVIIGGIGRSYKEFMNNKCFYLLPFEDLTVDQLSQIQDAAKKDPSKFGFTAKDVVGTMTFKFQSEEHAGYKEPSSHKYAAGDFKDTSLIDIDAYKQNIEKFEQALNKTNHWYNKRSSPEYIALTKSLNTMKDNLNKWPGAGSEKLHEAIESLKQTAKDYQKHVGKEGKNANQKARLAATNEILDFTVAHPVDKLILEMTRNDATVSPDEKAFHMNKLAIMQKEQAQKAKEDMDLYKAKEENKPLSKEEELLKKGNEKTKELKALKDALPEGNLKDLKSQEIGYREDLVESLGKKNFKPKDVQTSLAFLITNRKMQQAIQGKPEKAKLDLDMSCRNQAEILLKSEAFQKATSSITKKDVAFLLQDDKEPSAFIKKIEENIKEEKLNKSKINEKSDLEVSKVEVKENGLV